MFNTKGFVNRLFSLPSALPLSQAKRILVVRYRFIGDTVLLIPFLRNLRYALPDATIDVLVAPNSGEVLTHCPYIDNLIYFDTTRKHRYESVGDDTPHTLNWYAQQLKNSQYDAAFVLKRSLSSAWLTLLAGIPARIGFNTEGRGLLLTKSFAYDDTSDKSRHESQCFLDALRAVNIPVIDEHLEAFLTTEEEDKIHSLFQKALTSEQISQPKLLIHITASNDEKCWPVTFWQKIVPWLLKTYPVTLHCVGAAMDGPAYNQITKQLDDKLQQRFFNWCGQTNLLQSQALIKRCVGVIGVDSGTLHLASAVSVPVVALFNHLTVNDVNAKKWHPLGQHQIIFNDPKNESETLMHVQQACGKLFNLDASS